MAKTEKERLEEIEKAKNEFSEKMKNEPHEVSSHDAAKLMGMKDEYKKAVNENNVEGDPSGLENDNKGPITDLDVLKILDAPDEVIEEYFKDEDEHKKSNS